MFGSCDIRQDFHRSVGLWQAGKLQLDTLISVRIDLAALPEELRVLDGGSVAALRRHLRLT
ncbi:hypothetical protein ACWDKQ_28765 [Saccharopolyspora sp. NPDC000995]